MMNNRKKMIEDHERNEVLKFERLASPRINIPKLSLWVYCII